MHFDSFTSHMIFMITLVVLTFRCSAAASANYITALRQKKPISPKQTIVVGVSLVIITVAMIIVPYSNEGLPYGGIGTFGLWSTILSFTIHAAVLVWTNDKRDCSWTRFLIKDLLDKTPLPAARG